MDFSEVVYALSPHASQAELFREYQKLDDDAKEQLRKILKTFTKNS